MDRRKAVLIVGGGIAGLVAAKCLGDRQFDVDIVEIKREWTVYGVGIIQQGNVVRAMAQAGLLDRYLASACSFDEVELRSAGGELLALIPGHRLAGPEYPSNVAVTRSALHGVLTTAAIEAGARVRLGVSVDAIEQQDGWVEARLTDGTTGRYEAVVGADGIYSRVRELIFPHAPRPRFTGQAGWRHNFPRPPKVERLIAFHGGKVGAAGLCPLSQELMYLFLTSHEPGNPRIPEDRLPELMRERLSEFGGIIGELRTAIVDPREVVYKPFEVVELDAPWHRGRVIVIGDAAHATTPHMGQGAGMAIEDAVVLAEELSRRSSVERAFEAFMERRFERCIYVRDRSIAVGEWEMNPYPGFDRAAATREMLEVTAQPI